MKNKELPAMPQSLAATSRGDIYSSFDDREQHGLSKREYLAGLAMQGLLSNSSVWNDTKELAIKNNDSEYSIRQITKSALEHADALLDALEDAE